MKIKNKIYTAISYISTFLLSGWLCSTLIKIYSFIEWVCIIATMFVGGWLIVFFIGGLFFDDEK